MQPLTDMTVQPSALRSRLLLDHAELDDFLEQLIAAFRTGDRDAARAAYREVEARLAAHFTMEEELLFPEFSRTDPDEARDLRAEHAMIRRKLEELGIGVELHQTRLPAIEEIAQRLREHAERENQLVYRWADRMASDPTRRSQFENFFTHGRSPAAKVQ